MFDAGRRASAPGGTVMVDVRLAAPPPLAALALALGCSLAGEPPASPAAAGGLVVAVDGHLLTIEQESGAR